MAISIAFLVSGCGDSYLPILEEDIKTDAPATDQMESDVVDAKEDTGDRDLVVIEGKYQILPQIDNSKPIEAVVGTQIKLDALVVDYMADAPAPDITVNYVITNIEDLNGDPADGDANLESAAIFTDQNGRVSNDFFVGMVPEVIYTITLSLPDYPDTEPVQIQVKVNEFACGCLNVNFTYEGVITAPLHDIEVFVVPSAYQCGKHIFPGTILSEDVIYAQRSATSINSEVTFDCLPAGAFYTVYAQAKGQQGACTVAGGCSRTLIIMPDTCDSMTLEFSEVTFQAAGRYNAVDHFNFEPMIEMCAGGGTTIIGCITAGTEDIGKLVCCAIQEVIKLFKTPGTTIVELVFDALKLWIGSAIIDTVEAIIGGPLKGLLNDLIQQWSADTPWLAAFLAMGTDITQIISNLELESELQLDKVGGNYTIQGTHYWHALNLYWRAGCAAEGAPGYDPECGKFSLNMKDIDPDSLPPNFPMDILEGQFIADVLNFDRLSLRQHEIALSYGKLVLWALNEIVIPQVSGGQAHSIDELAKLWLNCAGLAAGQLGDYWEQAGGDRDDVENTCNGVVNTLINPVDTILGKLTLATTLTLTGTGRMMDENCDMIIDKIVDGTYIGYIESNSQQASVTGDWEATRITAQ
jgi:hypothetical protein